MAGTAVDVTTADPVGEPYQVIDPDGRPVAGRPVGGIDDDGAARLLAAMVGARVANHRFFSLQRQGRTGTFAPIEGEEATVVGAAAALDPALDWVVPYYRELLGLAAYGPEVLFRYALYQRGHPGGGHLPEGTRVLFPQISLAAQLPHAVGIAWGMQRNGTPGCVVAFCGDGATSEGDFAESANLAGVRRAPVIFVVKNNGWAISTPLAAQTAAPTLAIKAQAFGFPGVRVDGNDVLAVRHVLAAARRHAVAGRGPVLVEAVTYRMGPHTTADDPTRYVPAGDRAGWSDRDPIERLRRYLRADGRWTDGDDERAEAEGLAAVDAAWARAEAEPLAPEAFFDHVYAHRHPRLERQRAEFLARQSRADGAS